MDLPKNTFKAQLASGDVTFGLWCGLGNSITAEICACAGYDWLLLDAEHAPLETGTLLHSLQAIAAYPSAPIVRPLSDDPAGLKRLLDIGAQSFLIPMVHDADQAARIVQSVRYPPEGVRGLGTSLARGARWNMVDDYIAKANSEICVAVQIESVEGLNNLEAITSTEGVDAVFIGPSDLGAALGFPGQASHPDVVAAVCQALSDIRALGKPAGVLAVTQELIDKYMAAGASFVGIGTDTGVLAKGVRALRNSLANKSADGDY